MSVVVIGQPSAQVLSCGDVFCGCRPPQFNACQCFCGCVTCSSSGLGLEWCCCYGCDRPDCCQVCCAGWALGVSASYIYGIVAGCIVGCRMMGCCQ